MRVTIAGAGALGSLLGGRLAEAGLDVTLLARGAHGRAMQREGLRLSGETDAVVHPTVVLPGETAPASEVVLVTCKTYDTEALLAERPDLFAGAEVVATAQNGLGMEEVLGGAVDADRVVGVTTSHGCTLLAPGHVRHAGLGDTVVGPWRSGGAEAALVLHGLLLEAGLAPDLVDDILPARWAKVAVNAAINPLATLLGLPNGALVSTEAIRTEMEAVAREVAGVALAAGVDVSPAGCAATASEVARRTAANRCSMLQDRDRGRRTEIGAITGAVARTATAAGVEAPRCRLLTALVQVLEAAGTTPGRDAGRGAGRGAGEGPIGEEA